MRLDSTIRWSDIHPRLFGDKEMRCKVVLGTPTRFVLYLPHPSSSWCLVDLQEGQSIYLQETSKDSSWEDAQAEAEPIVLMRESQFPAAIEITADQIRTRRFPVMRSEDLKEFAESLGSKESE